MERGLGRGGRPAMITIIVIIIYYYHHLLLFLIFFLFLFSDNNIHTSQGMYSNQTKLYPPSYMNMERTFISSRYLRCLST